MKQDPLWFKHAVFYQLHVKCFRDSNHDGIGDFRGLTEKLDHIQNLGCNAIWLQPFYPSPLRDDGYDIADYHAIHPDYGTLKDFKLFLKEAKERGIRVVTELVLNHTSDQHAWFKRARLSPKGSKWRNFYIWSEAPDKYLDCRIIFKDFETSNWAFDPVADSYYFHRFYSHQPDLNYDNPEVHQEIFKIVDFWLGMGVDGLRLDAVPYLYKREGTDCENLPETHAFLKKLRSYIDSKYENKMLLAEANQWPEQACLYFGEGDECHMAFHFPVMPRLFMAIHKEDRFPIIDILDQTPTPPAVCQWAMFLRNHDELTLEMVTDEERDYMWRVYAKDPRARINLGIRRRLAPLMENDRQKIELMFTLLLCLPGSPVIYYGDEIGMGDNYYLGDRNGVRTPMQWNNDRNAGFSDGDPQKLYLPLIIDPKYHHAHVNVENEEQSPSSLLSWIKTVIAIRQAHPAFGSGTLKFVDAKNPKVLAFVREYDGDAILVVVNLSRFSQYVEIDLADWKGSIPVDLFSHNNFANITAADYGLTLGRYGYFWLALEPAKMRTSSHEEPIGHKFSLESSWDEVLKKENRTLMLKESLPQFLSKQRWFRSKGKPIKKVQIQDEVKFGNAKILNVGVSFLDDQQENYQLPVTFIPASELTQLKKEAPNSIIAEIEVAGERGALADAVYQKEFRTSLLDALIRKSTMVSQSGEVFSESIAKLRKTFLDRKEVESSLMTMEQSNTSINYGDSVILKLYRRIEEGTNPDFELVRHLTEKSGFGHVPEYLGGIEWKVGPSPKSQIALAQRFIEKGTSAWDFTLQEMETKFPELEEKTQEILKRSDSPERKRALVKAEAERVFKDYLKLADLLGERTAGLHLAFSSDNESPEMVPESFSMLYQKSLYQAMRTQTKKTLELLKERISSLKPDEAELARKVLHCEESILTILKRLETRRFSAHKIRIHGDLHLGQIICTGSDALIIDFEGEPALPLGERRLKRPVIQDIAGMVRSFDYALTHFIISRGKTKNEAATSAKDALSLALRERFTQSYLNAIKGAKTPLVPDNPTELSILMNAFLLNKAIYEIGYEIRNRPDWIQIPMQGLLNILKEMR
ncbi:maltose alpha-D-glucosyltransferase [Estrella lausannensis]|uniref:Maltokinase n=1 Tax=Estrella lausannensis TaxID=483423 RepID=A0A0H5DQ88_9BACT|nr:maltose alpha-D-glucosyltransferase [Estrella lausannensis]CRX38223.1 Putative trehalose synthase/maltokinase [Estrella lausannensis]